MPIVSHSVVNSDVVDDFDRALDSIELHMKSDIAPKEVEHQELKVTSEELRQIVTVAVTDAIAAYERLRSSKAEAVRDSAPPAVPQPAELARLQEEMGLLEEIEFEETGPKPELAALSADMGIDGFAFDAPRRPDQYPHAPTDQTVAAALADWGEALKRLSSGP